jgi:hypothetical protein
MSVSCPEKTNQNNGPLAGDNTYGMGNSERIRLKFGSYGIEVVESEQGIRVSNLFSIEDGVRTNRTFAVVAYPETIEPAFIREHKAIINGQSIGIVFKENGWVVEKRHQYFGKVKMPSGRSNLHALFGDIGKIQPVIHVYSLFIRKDNFEFEYASIAEVHHPEYLKLEDLSAIYGSATDSASEMNDDLNVFLEIVKSKLGAT